MRRLPWLLLLVSSLVLAQSVELETARELLDSAPDRALAIAREVREQAAHDADERLLAQARVVIAEALSALAANDEAIAEIRLAVTWFERNANGRLLAEAQKAAGDIHLAANNFEAALSAYQSAQSGFETAGYARGMAEVLSSTGTLFFYQERYDDAYDYYRRSKAAFEEIDGFEGAGRQLANIGNIHTVRGDFEAALSAYEESLALMEQLGERQSVARILNNIGATYERKGEPENVVHWYQRALEHYQAINDRQGISETLSNLGVIFRKLGRVDEARSHFERARTLAAEVGNLRARETASRELAKLEEAQGRPTVALALLHEASEIREERMSQERAEQIERMRALFDNVRKERELAQLQKQRQTQRIMLMFGAGLLLSLLAMLTMLIHRYRANQRVNRLMEQKNAELEKLQVELREAAATDYLTGIRNRRAFLPILEHELASLARSSSKFSLLFLDIDHFKKVNDEHGHEVGDAILRGVVDRIRSALRVQDAVCRWGGEEFAVLLPSTDAAGAQVAAEKIRSVIASEPFDVDGNAIAVTVTIGGLVDPRPDDGVNDLIDRADQALYEGKYSGRNCVVLATHPSASSSY